MYRIQNIRYFITLLLVALTIIVTPIESLAEIIDLPDIGSTADAVLSVEEEKRLGKAFIRSARQFYKIVDDPLVNNYIQSLGSQLTSHIENSPFDFTFFVVDAPSINAFAGPGGYIGVNSGTILATESESELASVVAHEIAHVTQRHMQRSFEKAGNLSLPTAAAMIAAILLGAQNPQAASALLAASIAGSTQKQINFTRAHEKEADRVGMRLLIDSGYDPRAMPVFFEHLQRRTQMYSNVVPEFLSTHPITVNRISDSRNRAEQYPLRQASDDTSFHIIRAKFQVQSNNNPKSIARQFANSIKTGRYQNEFAHKYGYALALLANKDWVKSRKVINSLIETDQERVPYLLTQAQIEINAGKPQLANKLLVKALKLYPHNEPLTVLYTNTLLETGNTDTSRKLLKEQIRYNPENPLLYELLAKAEKRAGFSSAAYQALAEHDYLFGRIHLAIDHLQTALRQVDNNKNSKSRIEARLIELKKEILSEQ